MASTIFHHWRDQFRTLPRTRQRWILAGLWSLGVAVVFVTGFAAGGAMGGPGDFRTQAHRLAARNAALQDQVQGLQQQQKTTSTALAALRGSLASRDAELQKLKQEQAFYAKLIGIDGDRSGLGVHSLALSPVAGTRAWNFVATLVNTAENADAARGTLTLDLEGVREGKLATVAWAALAAPGARDGVPFAFKFFQQVRGSIMLPAGFVPNRVTVTLHPHGGSEVARRIEWKDALSDQSDDAP
ncbi:MAG TPA: DUF6776 family protein [Rhodanobacteraceae bacterium]|jgi:hypothetical protein|nr:DUF6776 family protein [Rhodanobacteraceae bacterium]